MTLLVRDEEDILDWNLRYHLSRGVDHFIVTDNLSVDRTPEILQGYEAQGLVTLLHESSDDYSQDLWVSRMAEIARTDLDPTWILHSDADEFWWPNRLTDLKSTFECNPAGAQAILVQRENFLGPAQDDGEPFFQRMVYRQRQPANALGGPLLPKIAHRPMEGVYVHQGNHGLSIDGTKVESPQVDEISILHFPSRTPRQLQNKVAKGGAAYQRNTRFDPGMGHTWRSLHQDLIGGRFDEVVAKQFLQPEATGSPPEVIEDHRLRLYLSGL